MRIPSGRNWLGLFLLGSLLPASRATSADPILEYSPDTCLSDAQFGFSIAGFREKFAAGAPGRGLGRDIWVGRVYVVDVATSVVLRTIDNPAPSNECKFGVSISALGSNKLIIGAPGDDTGARDAGVVYVYNADTGSRLLTIPNPDPDAGDRFGTAVSQVLPNKILVGAPSDDTGADNAGSAYLFDGTTGRLLWTLQKARPQRNDNFGAAVAGNDRAIVGAPGDDLGASDAGAVYVFNATTGALLLTLENPEPGSVEGAADGFGSAVSVIFGDYLVGAPGEDALDRDAGAAYSFDRLDGDLVQTFNNPSPQVDDAFGVSVTGRGLDRAVVGARRADDSAVDAGAAYLFNADSGALLRSLTKSDGVDGDELGISLGVTDSGILVGGWRIDVDDPGDGAVELFQLASGPEMAVLGNDKVIPDGDMTPTSSDGSYFGTVDVAGGTSERGFEILNIGALQLRLGGKPRVAIGGQNAAAFSVVAQPAASAAAYGGSTTFRIRFDPASRGATLRATVSISNDDPDESPYEFTISGIGR